MNRKVSGFALLLLLLLGACLSAQTTWTGINSTNWNTASNWTNGLPGPFNEPTIPATPSGPNFPKVTVFTYFNFNVQNYGTLTLDGDGGVSQFGTFINHGSGTLVLANGATNFLVEANGTMENHGYVLNNGTFSNEGNFTNAQTGSFRNNHVFSHSSGGYINQGVYNNFGQFYSEASFQNIGTFNNRNLFNNNGVASNAGILHSVANATLRNDDTFTNLAGAGINISGVLLNNRNFTNQGQFTANPGSEITNSQLIRNATAANWNNQGMVFNVLCAIFENKGNHQNTGGFENEGFIYADSPISPNPPINMGSGVVITPSNTGSLCHNATVGLAANNTAVVDGLDLANNQLDFCTAWTILVNGQPSFEFIGCASVGPHNVNVSFIDPNGRTNICTAVVTVVDDLAPIISCQPTQTLQISTGLCTAPANLSLPSVLVENCAVASITNNALALLPIGQTQVIWTVTDQNGNAGYCTQMVVVVDQLPPSINCPPAKTLNAEPNQCGLSNLSPAIAGDPAFAFDNCSTPTVSNNAPPLLPLGTSTIIWMATDAFGNTATCPQQITVLDNQPPVIANCPADIIVQPQTAGCQAVATWGPALATDNCGVPTQVFSISSGSVFNMGTTPITVLVSDASLNVATCQFNVTVVDMQPPTWSNCPNNSTITLLDCGDVAIGTWTPPTANDPCLGGVASNFQPGDVLPLGQNLIEYTATDQSGNSAACSFTITVEALLALDCPSDIMVNAAPGSNSSPVSWNVPSGTTNCTVCASVDIPGFMFMAEKAGHRYYTYLGGPVTWQEANDLASQHGGYLAAIGEANENELLRKEFSPLFQTAWIGASDALLEGHFIWPNGEDVTYTNWQNGTVPANDPLDFVLLRNDGLWVDAAADALHVLIMEVPCYQLDVSSSNAMALNNLIFPLGNTTISYEVTDNCGNTCFCDFSVQVFQNQQVATCVASGNSDFGWIENVQTEGFSNPSGNDGGHGNYSNSVFELPDLGCILKLTPGGPASDKYLYWRIWADLNQDGDYFDDNEILASLEGVGEQDFCYDVLANLPTGLVGLRIAMSRWDYVAACGDFIAGEAEDYTVNFLDSAQYHQANCDWTFGVLQAEQEALSINLTWLGNSNCDVAKFIVERASDGLQYEAIGEVQPVASGQLPVMYDFTDRTPIYGHNFYRIKVVMADSTEVVSNFVEMDFNIDKEAIFVYPNPVNSEAVLHIYPFNGQTARVFIANTLGQMVFDQLYKPLENAPILLDLHGFAQGVYTIYVRAEGQREQVRRLVVQQP
jgi:hypothetical protein